MQVQVSQKTAARTGRFFRIVKRWVAKTLIFCAATFLILNPNLKRAFLQAGHILRPEDLIQTNFASLPEINMAVDRFVAVNGARQSEAKLISKWVTKKLRYVTDYENWKNIEYWPTPEEAWQRRQEDCDGRAILATSILRSRGYESARLVVGLDHMWIRVNVNEKEPSKPTRYVSLLSPNEDFSLELSDRPRADDMLHVAKAFLQPTAFRETSTHLFAELPPIRKGLLIMTFLLLCCYPSRSRVTPLIAIGLGLSAAIILAVCPPGNGQIVPVAIAGVLVILAMAAALFGERLGAFRN